MQGRVEMTEGGLKSEVRRGQIERFELGRKDVVVLVSVAGMRLANCLYDITVLPAHSQDPTDSARKSMVHHPICCIVPAKPTSSITISFGTASQDTKRVAAPTADPKMR